EDRVVLAPTAKRLDHAVDLVLAAEDRVDLSGFRLLVQILGEFLQRIARTGSARARLHSFFGGGLVRSFRFVLVGVPTKSVRNIVQDIETLDPLFLDEIEGMRILRLEKRDEKIGRSDLVFAGGLDLKKRPLDHALDG